MTAPILIRYPFAPIERHILLRQGAVSAKIAASQLGVTSRQVQRYRLRGLNVNTADLLANRLGFHPLELWDDWGDDGRDWDLYDRLLEWWQPLRQARTERIETWCHAHAAR